jgi:hypothetical protein
MSPGGPWHHCVSSVVPFSREGKADSQSKNKNEMQNQKKNTKKITINRKNQTEESNAEHKLKTKNTQYTFLKMVRQKINGPSHFFTDFLSHRNNNFIVNT